MKVNLQELFQGQKNTMDIEVQEPYKNFNYYKEEISFKEPVVFRGQAYRVNHEVFLKATVEGVALLKCHRCLTPFEHRIVHHIQERVTVGNHEQDEEDELFSVQDYLLDISEIIENSLVLAFPMKVVCDDNCKGLCLVCGTNLNVNPCECEKNEIDPRLLKLKDLLQKD